MLSKFTFFIISIFIIIFAFIFIQNTSEVNVIKDKNIININTEKCDITNQTCEVNTNEFRMMISFNQNVYYLKPFNISVKSESLSNINLESIQVDFKMKGINMGVNRFKLKKVDAENNIKIWKGKALLAICVTGRADWISEFEIKTKNNKYLVSIPIFVKKAVN